MKKLLLIISLSLVVSIGMAQSTASAFSPGSKSGIKYSAVDRSQFSMAENVTVYPNPATDLLKVSIRSEASGSVMLSLYNNIGSAVFEREFSLSAGSNLIQVDIQENSIEPGVYYLQLRTEKQFVTRKLIVK
jgi:uncharacterized protein YdeI (BOF family)